MVNAISTPDQNTLKVAVVVPTYNESETLPQLIEKVVAQGIDGLGFIVVDDGSPDGTGALPTDSPMNLPAFSLFFIEKASRDWVLRIWQDSKRL
ncbi:MAG: hypothetical protein CM1200mP39_21600 [Dehalococcoidia bacterium]|nr:MAG: hypothetical protein CM1200mP39_21600 [Dehalococcoidia bacterium]